MKATKIETGSKPENDDILAFLSSETPFTAERCMLLNVPEPAWIDRIRKGLPGKTVGTLARMMGVPQKEVAGWLHTTTRTLQRSANLNPEVSDRLAQFLRVFCRCNEVFKDENKASTWLKTPNYALGGVAPTSLLDTIPGIGMVLDELGRIEHGIFV